MIRLPKQGWITTDWKVGIVPAMVAGVGVYLMTRYYFNTGTIEWMDVEPLSKMDSIKLATIQRVTLRAKD